MIKKADIMLAAVLIILGIGASYLSVSGDSGAERVVITAHGKEFGTYSLAENRHILVEREGHTNEIIIKDGEVSMFFSDCNNQVCVQTGRISRTSQSIVCLPNKVMVQIEGKGETEYDAVSN